MSMITGKCGYEGCQEDITPAKSTAQFSRNRGLHMKTAHSVPGLSHTREGRKKLAQIRLRDKIGIEVEPVSGNGSESKINRDVYKQAYQKGYRAAHKNSEETQASAGAELKFICPCCQARVWVTAPRS